MPHTFPMGRSGVTAPVGCKSHQEDLTICGEGGGADGGDCKQGS